MTAYPLPALLGGPPTCPAGPPDWPPPDEDVLASLAAAYRTGAWGKYHGGGVEQLEERLARYHGVEHALTCASGTVAVEIALRALQVGPGDEVAMAAYDYGGNFLSVHAAGAHPVLVEVSRHNWNLDPSQLDAAVSPATRAILVSHLHGGLVPMRAVLDVAGAHRLPVIEDAAQCPGAIVQGRKAGAWGDVGVLSFGGSKLLTAGRGGAMLTRRRDVFQRARLWLHRGNHVCPLSELQAAALLPQLDKLDERNRRREQAVRRLVEGLRDVPGLRLFANPIPEDRPGYYKVGIQYDAAAFGLPRKRFLDAVRAEGVALDAGFSGLHKGRSPRRFRAGGPLPEADRAHDGLVVLHHPVLLEPPDAIDDVARALRKVYAYVEQLTAPSTA